MFMSDREVQVSVLVSLLLSCLMEYSTIHNYRLRKKCEEFSYFEILGGSHHSTCFSETTYVSKLFLFLISNKNHGCCGPETRVNK